MEPIDGDGETWVHLAIGVDLVGAASPRAVEVDLRDPFAAPIYHKVKSALRASRRACSATSAEREALSGLDNSPIGATGLVIWVGWKNASSVKTSEIRH